MSGGTITIDNKEYNINELSDEINYLVNQVSDLKRKSAEHKFNLDQTSVAQAVFTHELKKLLAEQE